MTNYRKLNNIGGWLVFAISTIVYFLTVEPTASWWDCGEYIATAYKLQVGHPPGAPLFQMIGRFFSLFAFGDVTKVALMINVMSALCSSFTILFLFWTITKLAKKVALINGGEFTQPKMFAVLGSGLVGALAFTFSDSFWFSAVEGEVYAMSSFFTALVFWAILKWEEEADDKYQYRWIILIAYLIGLSIGVHLLNLLAIPAIAYVYYYKKYEPTTKGLIYTGIFSILILAGIMYILVPWIVKMSTLFELLFVNTFGLPFNSGTFVYFALLIGFIVWGIRYTIRRKKVLLNTLMLAFVFILIGYSSFFMLVIRSNANVPIDENSPEEAISMLSYLNREQYGSWPLIHGPYFNAPVIAQENGSAKYFKDKKAGKYTIVGHHIEAEYDPKLTTFFPRMWSDREPRHAQIYKRYISKGKPVRVVNPDGSTKVLTRPTFADNLRFFFSYQVGHMYLRYFMWNFSGRQNDIESQGEIIHGNWITGIGFIDRMLVGDQDLLPDAYKNEATNTFFLLPLLLGLIGAFYHFIKNSKDTWVVFLLFFMTGLAIVIYLNQYPNQPRERDYAFAGSFYAFAIWIGLGVLGISEFISKYLGSKKMVPVVVSLLSLILVPGIMASEGWDDHDRSGKTAARDFAKNYLGTMAPNSVIYTIGDNDTFPLWYVQEVEDFRTDVRVVNHMLSSGEWYVLQLGKKAYEADPLPFAIPPEKYDKGQNEYVYYYPRPIEGAMDLKTFINFIKSDRPESKLHFPNGDTPNFFPTLKVKLKVDSAACVDNGIVPKELAHLIVDEIEWELKVDGLYKNDLAFLDFVANNDWTRPLYFTNPIVVDQVFDIREYMFLEGSVYRFMPIKNPNYTDELGGVSELASYDILMNKTQWGNLNNPRVAVDRESTRNNLSASQNFWRTARALQHIGENEKAIKLLDKYFEIFPFDKFPLDSDALRFLFVYYQLGAIDQANMVWEELYKRYTQEVEFYLSFGLRKQRFYENQLTSAFSEIQTLSGLAENYKQDELAKKADDFIVEKLKGL